jgi:transposase-like protein
MSKRKFTKQEKLSILKEVFEYGISKTRKEYVLYVTDFYSRKEIMI